MRFHDEFDKAVELIVSGAADVQKIITGSRPIGEAVDAFHLAFDRGQSIKVVLDPPRASFPRRAVAKINIRNVLVIDATRLQGRPSAAPRCTHSHPYVKNLRGIRNWKEASDWLEWRGIEDIECITPDQAGVARGKMMPSNKFTSNTSLACPPRRS
jgi:hypothetical protein